MAARSDLALPAPAPTSAVDGLPSSTICSCTSICSSKQPVLRTPTGQPLPERVFCCLRLRGRLRQAAIAVTFDPAFEYLILVAILVNCLFMAGFSDLEAQTEL